MTAKIKYSFIAAAKGTRKSWVWLMKLMIPISLGVTLLQHFGFIAWLAQYLEPLFVPLGLPGSSAIIFVSGALAGTYAGVAALMLVFGLKRSSAYMWLVGNVLGISYGSAVMIELQEKGIITRQDANEVNYHLIMSHSLLEDTIVLALTGIPVFWILSTRILFAIIVVWLHNGVRFFVRR